MDEEAGLTLCGRRAARHLPPSFRAGLRRRGVEVIPSAEIVSRYAVAAPDQYTLRPNGLEVAVVTTRAAYVTSKSCCRHRSFRMKAKRSVEPTARSPVSPCIHVLASNGRPALGTFPYFATPKALAFQS